MTTPPGKPTAAGMLLVDDRRRILLVDPTYKPGWEIPGGMVELGEAPRAGARREVAEELGLDIAPGRLLSVDYRRSERHSDSLRFVFGGRTLLPDDVARIQLPPDELSEWGVFTLADATERVPPDLGRVIENCLAALASGETLYLEH